MNIKRLFHILPFLGAMMLLSLSSCQEETIYLEAVTSGSQDEVPVIINVVEMDSADTRSVDNSKTAFSEGDVIHVCGEFTDKEGTVSYRYGAMKLSNNKWIPADGNSDLKWPIDAIKGNFTAYYICDGNGDLIVASLSGNSQISVKLADIQDDKDPLMAQQVNVDYGHAISLSFRHICTHLTFTELDYGVTNQYWLVKKSSPLCNLFSLSLLENGKLSFEFQSVPDEDFDDLVYIPRNYVPMENGDGVKVSFFLKPGDYSEIDLRTLNNHPYLSWTSENTQNLEGNKTYTVNVKQSLGVTIIEDTETEWDEDNPIEVDPHEFLKSIQEQSDYYTEDGQQVLRKVDNGILLLHCVSFKNHDQEYYEDFVADNPNGKVFDGNFHYISDLKFPLFRYNFGTIQNLGLKKLAATVTSSHSENESEDRSSQGGLCRTNLGGATIHNVRLENINLTVKIKTSNSQESHYSGCLTGLNSGQISSVFTKGTFNLNIENAERVENMDAKVIAGGLIGQNEGTVADVLPLEDSEASITVFNKASGNAATFQLGGGIGYSSGPLSHIILPNVNVSSASDSKGAVGYVGGLVGNLRSNIDSPSMVQDCMVGGRISGCNIAPFGSITSPFLYMGGIAGCVMNFSVLNSRTVCDVIGNTSSVSEVTYAHGGGFGRIISSLAMEDLTIYENLLQGCSSIGSFAGIAPSGETWENNYSTHNNLVREFSGIQFIGSNADSNDTTEP